MFFKKLIDHVVDVLYIAAAFYGGGNGILAAKAPGNFNVLTDSFIKRHCSCDAHAIKHKYFGDKANVYFYRLYQNMEVKKVLILRLKKTAPIIETYFKIK